MVLDDKKFGNPCSSENTTLFGQSSAIRYFRFDDQRPPPIPECHLDLTRPYSLHSFRTDQGSEVFPTVRGDLNTTGVWQDCHLHQDNPVLHINPRATESVNYSPGRRKINAIDIITRSLWRNNEKQ